MGRGLSDLQKWILVRARQNRVAEGLGPALYRVEFRDPTESLPRGSLEWRRCRQQLREAGVMDFQGVWRVDTPESEAKLQRLMGFSVRTRALVRALGRAQTQDESDFRWPNGAFSPIDGGYICSQGGRPGIAASPQFEDRAEAVAIADRLAALQVPAWVACSCEGSADLLLAEILGQFYGFDAHRKMQRIGPAPGNGREPGDKLFDRQAIGEQRYNAATVAARKAFSRLEQRDLAVVLTWRRTPGIKLTRSGLEVAEQLSAHSDSMVSTVSR